MLRTGITGSTLSSSPKPDLGNSGPPQTHGFTAQGRPQEGLALLSPLGSYEEKYQIPTGSFSTSVLVVGVHYSRQRIAPSHQMAVLGDSDLVAVCLPTSLPACA